MNNSTEMVTETTSSSIENTVTNVVVTEITTEPVTTVVTRPATEPTTVLSIEGSLDSSEISNSETSNETATTTSIIDTASIAETSEIIESSISETENVMTEIAAFEGELETASITAVDETSESSEKANYIESGFKFLIIFIAIIAFIVFISKNNKNKKIADNDNKSAKQRDTERIAKNKIKKDKGKKTAVNKSEKSKSAVNTLPYIKVLSNDIWLIAPNTYSKAYSFADINYNLGDVKLQCDDLTNYSNFLNTLDDTVDCQITCWNCGINVEQFERDVLIDEKNDDYNEYRQEYNQRVLKESLHKGQNGIEKKLIVTLTIKTVDADYAERKFRTLDIELKNSFDRIGNTHLRVMTSQQRVEMLKDFIVGSDVKIPTFTADDYKNRLEKVYSTPDYFEFKSDYYMFNDKYARCIFIKDYPSKAADSIITDLMDTSLEIMVTTNIIAHDPAKARKLVQRQITAIDTNMAQRESKAAQHGNFSTQMPVRIKNQLDGFKSLYDKLTVDDQKLYSVNTIIMLTAPTYEMLEANTEIIDSTLKRNGCMYGKMKYQQEDGMYDCLPVGSHRKFEWRRSLPTESVAIFQPFNVKNVQHRNAIYYGLNVLSNNLIAFNRMKLINPSGFILGKPGTGKSFTAKREMMDAIMRYDDADIMIIDPEREYDQLVEMFGGESVKIAIGSSNYINPFDYDFNLLNDEDIDIISDKCQLITSFISCMDKTQPLNAQEVSFLDRCVSKAYEKTGVLKTLNKADMPTLGTLRDIIAEADDVDEAMQKKLLITLEMYVDGSAKYFNHATNVNVNNRIISYDIKDLTDTLKTQAMLLILDYIWNRLSANREVGRQTWIYFDEAHLLFADKYCLAFLKALYKRARKYGGVVTGITQNVEELLKDDQCRTMLSNSEFLILLGQAPADIIKLQDTLHFNDSEVSYVSNTKRGQGLLILGGKDKIPFYDDFPTDTELYKKITTAFSETAALKQAAAKK